MSRSAPSVNNEAAWILASDGQPFKVDKAPYFPPGDDEVVIEASHVAINPIDWKIAKGAPYINVFPNILGQDVAGRVFAVGKDVTEFKVGDKVMAYTPVMYTKNPAHGAFQRYPVAPATLVARVPEGLTGDRAAVLPLSITTAAAGLYPKDQLGLPLPAADGKASNATGQAILIWGGASSVGNVAIQLAKASGFEVFTTCSSRNFDLAKEAGAAQVFDYNKASVVQDIIAALQGKDTVGAYDAIATGPTTVQCAQVLDSVESPGNKKFVAATLPPPAQGMPDGITAKLVGGPGLGYDQREISKAIFHDFVPRALEGGLLKPVLQAEVFGSGIEKIQAAMDKAECGISGKKMIVSLK